MKPWYDGLNLRRLSEEDRAEILQYSVDKRLTSSFILPSIVMETTFFVKAALTACNA